MYVINPTAPFTAEFDALVQLLRDHHGFFDREAKLARSVLLQS
jgi:hypothetical protein